MDVAWDGGVQPLTQKKLYVLDKGKVSYWAKIPFSGWIQLWSYGTEGSGAGQFRGASGICLGHYGSPNGGSVFSEDFYVADAGNHRIVWLRRTGSGAQWMGSVDREWDGTVPADCTVDHWGNVYVADSHNSRIIKYTWDLEELDRYGSYGTGATNYNTFAHPRSIHVPFGLKNVGGQTVWYGEGRILTAEDWGPNSGGLEHWLGVTINAVAVYGTVNEPGLAQFRLTDHAYLYVSVHQGPHNPYNDPAVREVVAGSLFPSGWQSIVWDGTVQWGGSAPNGPYHFHIDAISTYGCGGEPWCHAGVVTETFNHWTPPPGGECDPNDPECYEVPVEENVALPLDGVDVVGVVPSAFRLGQVLSPYVGPLFRVEGIASGLSGAGALTGPAAVASVRASGIRALAVAVPAAAARPRVLVRIYSLAGRLVRDLVDESLDPAQYVVGWDGLDAGGRTVLPGVYVAVMTAGSYRGVQRLIIK